MKRYLFALMSVLFFALPSQAAFPEKPIRLEVFYLRIDDNPTFNLKEWTISETEAEPKKFQWKSKIKKQNPPKQSLF